ncbi:uncharacterized protein LOC129612085 [Condylostylus longicornis]|uniref:uncharacterized protein LOC129612085 n=1 Tax=Condylostylus longicornis TaxID=2530218 RepID=UPI00244D9D05|nr:uncharacterized protein LOC129612085 [Condylostylus longicornis]
MKISIAALLGLFFFSTVAASDLNFFEDIPEVKLIQYDPLPQGISLPTYVHDYFQNIVNQMNVVLLAFRNLVQNDKQEVEVVARAVQMDAMSKIDEILRKVQEIVANGGKISECAAGEEKAIKEITELVADGIKFCAQDMIIALKDLTGGIMKESNELIATINELKEVVKYCMSKGKLGQAFCITGNLTKGLRLVKKIISDAQTIFGILQERSGKLVAAAKDCNNNHIQVIYGKLKIIKNNVEQCVKNN